MTKLIAIAVLGGVLLAVPANAQQMDYDTAARAYYAMEQVNREVWLTNPNQAEASRHAMMIVRDWGFYPGFEPADYFPDPNPELREHEVGGDCIWLLIDGEWVPRCQTIYTMRCSMPREIDMERSMKNSTAWVSLVFGAASGYAGYMGFIPPAAVLFTGSVVFQGFSQYHAQRLERMEASRCVNP